MRPNLRPTNTRSAQAARIGSGPSAASIHTVEPTVDLAWRRRARPLLGTRVEVSIFCSDEAEFMRLSDAAFARLGHYHVAMSFHEATSDVRRIASAAPGTTLRVAPETWAVIAAAQAFEAESDGVFNVAIGLRMMARGRLPACASCSATAAPETSARASLRLEADSRVTVLRPVWLDLGGIAKGAAVDAALAVLRGGTNAHAAAAIVNAGGDLATFGAQAQPIRVRGPNGSSVHAGCLADGAIATSGPFDTGADTGLVLPDGHKARWADRSVSVVAATALVADALTKVLAALGTEAGPLLGRHAAHGFSIDRAGRLERVA